MLVLLFQTPYHFLQMGILFYFFFFWKKKFFFSFRIAFKLKKKVNSYKTITVKNIAQSLNNQLYFCSENVQVY